MSEEIYLNTNAAKAMYTGLIKQGYDKKAAAKETQAKTGVSTVSWSPIGEKRGNAGRSRPQEKSNGFGF